MGGSVVFYVGFRAFAPPPPGTALCGNWVLAGLLLMVMGTLLGAIAAGIVGGIVGGIVDCVVYYCREARTEQKDALTLTTETRSGRWNYRFIRGVGTGFLLLGVGWIVWLALFPDHHNRLGLSASHLPSQLEGASVPVAGRSLPCRSDGDGPLDGSSPLALEVVGCFSWEAMSLRIEGGRHPWGVLVDTGAANTAGPPSADAPYRGA